MHYTSLSSLNKTVQVQVYLCPSPPSIRLCSLFFSTLFLKPSVRMRGGRGAMSTIRLCIAALLYGLLQPALSATVGFNYGTLLSTVPSPLQVVNLLKTQHVTSLRLYDANPSLLQALAGTGIQVTLTLPNNQLLSVGESNATAGNWVKNNVLAYLPDTNITSICVGTEVLTKLPNAALLLLPAMRFVHTALVAANLDSQIKVTTSHSTQLILDSFPPSQAFFNRTWNPVLQPLLQFLSSTGSYFMLNVYPYDVYKASSGILSLDYALLNPVSSDTEVVDSNTLLQYSNLFDAILDSAFFSMAKLNYTNLPIVVGETGWPSKGDSGDTEATADNAAVYNSNIIRHIVNNTGTPKYPRAKIDTFLFELFNEDLRPGLTTGKNYGLFNSSNMQPIYLLRLTGSGPLLSNDTTNQLFCVARPGFNSDELQIALDWVCGPGLSDCSAIQPGDLCYEPDTVEAHASFAFNSFFQAHDQDEKSCDFHGVAIITTTNPSYGTCIYPGSAAVSNRTTGNAMNSTVITNATASINNNSTTASGSATAAAQIGLFNLCFFIASLLLVTRMPITRF